MWQELLETTKRLEALERLNSANAAAIEMDSIVSLTRFNNEHALELDALERRIQRLEKLNEINHSVLSTFSFKRPFSNYFGYEYI